MEKEKDGEYIKMKIDVIDVVVKTISVGVLV